MRKFLATMAVLAIPAMGVSSAAHAEPHEYELDPAHTSIGFLVGHVGYDKVLGMFLESSGSFTYDEETQTLSDVKITIESESVFTNHEKRDQHLRSPDFLNAREFPEMTFTVTKAEKISDTAGKVYGELELIGLKKPIVLDVTLNKAAEYPFNDSYAIGISARGSFKRSEYGMMYGVDNGWVGDDVELIIEFEAVRQ
ncbi:polyisoprenoid-binding protein [Hwanghaeella grinnelliae]|uniref:Polyisoprenoid-binding protein n=1 Tax=Hwanghaeella grinnelliae TaxID=2500179 RepID=A0A437QX87_9PROT|nr:YceI family protein [Hwanghaeella grinnelliae]RVU39141.1 polyisoprenoid-binding protein [Hwanghaeella grinnelliae]